MKVQQVVRKAKSRWLAVIFAALLATLFIGTRPTTSSIAVYAIAGTAVLIGAVLEIRKNRGALNRPDGVLIIGAGQMLAVAAVLAPMEVRTSLYLGAALLGALGTIRLIIFRIGSRPKITERETAIVAAGLGVVFFILVAEPSLDCLLYTSPSPRD